MATTKTSSHPKEKSSSATSTPNTTDAHRGRKTSRPSTPDKEPANYLKPTVSSRNISEASRASRSSHAAAGKRVLTSKPTNKPPSPSLQTPRTSSSIRERAAKTTTSLPRTTVSPKLSPDKAPKTLRSAGTSVGTKREARAASPVLPTTTASRSPEVIEEEEAAFVEVTSEEVKPEEDERKSVDIPQVPVQHEHTESLESKLIEESVSEPVCEPEEIKAPPPQLELAQEVAKEVDHDDKEEELEEPSHETQENSATEATAKPAVEPVEEREAEKPTAALESSVETEEKKPENAVVEDVEKVVAAPKQTDVVGRKKEGPPAGNAVIEERLVAEKRKNKVLALVGAFETVISLQEPEGGQQAEKQPSKEERSNETKESTESM